MKNQNTAEKYLDRKECQVIENVNAWLTY